MANISYDALLPYVLHEVHGCSDPLAEQAIRDAVIDFCQRSLVWKYICDPADVIANQATYDIDLPTNAALARIDSVRMAGYYLIDPVTTDQLDQYRRGDWDTNTGQARSYTQIDDETFLCTPIPTATQADQLLVRLSVKPSRSSSGFPNWINERYQDVIVAGAKAMLMRKQGTAWYNPQQAAAYQGEFDAGVAAAQEHAAGSLVRAPLRTTTQY